MKIIVAVFAICCLKAAQARPGYHGGGGQQLHGSPDLESFSKIHYPKFDIIDLGEHSKGELPPKVVFSEKHITIKIPQPYPVKIPYKVPVPVPVEKPYPVVHTKIIKVPQPVPYPVEKKVPVPIEVPKPYPVPVHEHHGGEGFGGGDLPHRQSAEGFGDAYGGGEAGHQLQQLAQTYGVPGQQAGTPLGEQEYNDGGGAYQSSSYEASYQSHEQSYGGEADQSEKYESVAQPKADEWNPLNRDNGQQRQKQDQQQEQNGGESKNECDSI